MHDGFHLDLTPVAAPAVHPLVARLERDLGWPRVTTEAAAMAFVAGPGAHCLFVPGDARRNLETPDAAVILPEVQRAFGGLFDCAVVDDAIEAALRDRFHALKAPGLLFFRDGRFLGAIEKLRDWPDYLTRTAHILQLSPV
jgi:hydrogenase-1 operon protein HyaE